jgi:hypothetical protein
MKQDYYCCVLWCCSRWRRYWPKKPKSINHIKSITFRFFKVKIRWTSKCLLSSTSWYELEGKTAFFPLLRYGTSLSWLFWLGYLHQSIIEREGWSLCTYLTTLNLANPRSRYVTRNRIKNYTSRTVKWHATALPKALQSLINQRPLSGLYCLYIADLVWSDEFTCHQS